MQYGFTPAFGAGYGAGDDPLATLGQIGPGSSAYGLVQNNSAATPAPSTLSPAVNASVTGPISKTNFGNLIGDIGTGVDILGNLSNIYAGFQQRKLAKRALNNEIAFANRNLANTTQSYNTQLEDRIRARHAAENKGSAATEAYLQRNRLSTAPVT